MDFMKDSLTSGRTFRTLNIIDDFNRESIWIAHYNQHRPHERLQNLSPNNYKLKNQLHLQTNPVRI